MHTSIRALARACLSLSNYVSHLSTKIGNYTNASPAEEVQSFLPADKNDVAPRV